jgi:acyl-CoA reductase-like NAD-dependent aldehyde dehydrogenase
MTAEMFDVISPVDETVLTAVRSGLGRELGPDAVEAFTETKNVFISTEE